MACVAKKAASHHSEPHTSYDDDPHHTFVEPTPPRYIRKRMLLVFSLLPGANYMYMGHVKRGLVAVCGFFLLVYLWSIMTIAPLSVLFGLSIFVYWLTSTFDGFHLRRRINAGEAVPDGVNDLVTSIIRNKTLTVAVVAVLAISITVSILGLFAGLLSNLLPLVLIALGIYIIIRRRRRA